jgi:uncharacterized surface protein with fasciclin (FAS1) repeats
MINLIETINAAGSMRILSQALHEAGLTHKLSDTGPYTIFAPTDEAFTAVFQLTLESLLSAPRLLRALLTSHLVAAELDAVTLLEFEIIETIHGALLVIEQDSADYLVVNGVRVIQSDLRCANGIIHIIDRILIHSQAAGLFRSFRPAPARPQFRPGLPALR